MGVLLRQIESFWLEGFKLEGVAVEGGLKTFPLADDIPFDLQELVKLSVDVFEAALKVLILFGNVFVFGLKVIDEELVELILTVRKDQTGSVVLDFLNQLKSIFYLSLVYF